MPCQQHESPVRKLHGSSHSTTQPPGSCEYAIRFSHHTEPGSFVNMMRAAQLSGLAYYSDTTHLCMHPVYGPWLALRAVAVFNVDGPDPAGFCQLPCPYPDLEAEAAVKVMLLPALSMQVVPCMFFCDMHSNQAARPILCRAANCHALRCAAVLCCAAR
jgi:hypothetical protein